MADTPNSTGFRLGVFDAGVRDLSMTTGQKVAYGLAGFWALGTILYLLGAAGPDTGPDPLRRLMAIVVIALPAGLVWLGVTIQNVVRASEAQGEALQAALDQFRKAQAEGTQRSIVGVKPMPAAPRATDPLPVAAAPGGTGGRAFATPVAASTPSTTPPDTTPGLFGDDGPPPDLPVDTLIRALHFPETDADQTGFAALRAALRHHHSAGVVRSAQDVLTLLSQDGIYMDDLLPDRARPDIWRRFATGARGREISALGGIRDRAALALSARRMREEPIFRDAAHHFLRGFDQTLARIEPEATDAEIARLSDTRSARAFMLIGRVTGLFD
ncbi:MAG: hypothetical protein AAFW64_03750 [Pseudomonadota bacterium]